MTIPSDIQVFCAAYEQYFWWPFASILCCCMIEKLDKVTFRKINIKYVLLTNANFNLALVHEFKYQ
jgi:hypothetical protein